MTCASMGQRLPTVFIVPAALIWSLKFPFYKTAKGTLAGRLETQSMLTLITLSSSHSGMLVSLSISLQVTEYTVLYPGIKVELLIE